MARPQKEGLDYFPLDTEMDDKVKLIDAKFGVAGFGILVKMWQIIYDNGYYITWTEKELLLYKTRINADINLINAVINECLRWGIFNDTLYKSYSILTSSGIQKRFFEATKRRTEVSLISEFILAPIPENYKPVIVTNNAVNVCNNLQNADSSTQSKEKKSKVKKNINNIYTPEFEKFYSEYPRPEDKRRSFNNWNTCLKSYTVDQLMTAARNYKKAKAGTQVQFMKSSANFLGKEKPFEDFLIMQPIESKYVDRTNYEPR